MARDQFRNRSPGTKVFHENAERNVTDPRHGREDELGIKRNLTELNLLGFSTEKLHLLRELGAKGPGFFHGLSM
jgi:hypothetical protein